MKHLTTEYGNTTIDNTMNKKNKSVPFHEWLDERGFTIQQFSALIGQGFATVASWRTKSVHGKPIVLKSASASNIARVCPSCPLVLK